MPWSEPARSLSIASNNTFVADFDSSNVFKRTPGGVITTIIDATGDGLGNPLMRPEFIAVNAADEIFVSGSDS
jgi:hypothetical protein